jgi:hypothetical protein
MKLTVENFLMIMQELELAAVENQNSSPQRHRGTEAQRHRGTEAQRHRGTEAQRKSLAGLCSFGFSLCLCASVVKRL